MSSKIAKNINIPKIWEVCLKMLLVCVVILSGFARFLLPAYEYVSFIIPGKHNFKSSPVAGDTSSELYGD